MSPGDVVSGRFAVERLAGSGGMGSVYRAVDQTTGAAVALKILHAQDLHGRERFENEARLLAGLEHPGIVRYVDHGETEGRPFLVMEWLDGEDLAAHLARRRPSIAETLALARALAGALAAAHARGVVHRDLKPSNVMLPAGGGAAAGAKIVDFGIARSGRAPRALTQTGALMGTPGYMAPEQVKSARIADARADVFSLGALLFECLTGRPAFAGDHMLAILAKLLLEEAPRARELNPDVPPVLDALVARMLSKERDDRPADGAAALAALDAIELPAAGAWVSASAPPPPGEPARATGLTGGEQRLLCVVLAAPAAGDATDPDASTVAVGDAREAERVLAAVLAAEGARASFLSGGEVLMVLEGGGAATDQAARAARCALSLRRALPELPVALVTGRSDASGKLPVGAVVERAAELVGGAAPGVLLDEVTRALLDVRFDVAEGPRGFELLDERAVGEAQRTLLGRPSPCVGRDRELRALSDLLAESADEGVARVALVTGVAGAGKSRVLSELLRHARKGRPGLEIWAGRADATSTAFGLLGSALRGAAGILGGEPLEARRRKLAERVARHVAEPQRARVAEFLGEVVGAPFADDESPRLVAARRSADVMADQIRLAWHELCAAECAAHPLLVVLEDLHWGDLPSVKLIDLALRELADRPLAVLACARPEVHDRFPRLWSERGAVEVRIGNLTRRAAESLVRHALGASAGAATIAALVERAAGNAFYLEELIRAVAEGHGNELPQTVLAMAEARLLALPPAARRLLRAGSLFGDVFWEGAVASLAGDGGEAPAGLVLAELVEQEVVARREASTFPGETEYAFRHALLREAAHGMLSDADRVLGHRLAAAWLEQAGESDPMVLAEHFERGGEPSRAVAFFRRAAEQALRGDDIDAAVVRADRGLACGAQGEDEIALLAVRGEAVLWRGGLDTGNVYLHRVIERAAPGSGEWFWALCGLTIRLAMASDIDAMMACVARIAETEALPDSGPRLVATLGVLSTFLFNMGEEERAGSFVRRLEEVGAGLSDRDPRTRGWLDFGRSARAQRVDGDLVAALDLARRATAAFREAGDRQFAALGRQREADLYLQFGASRHAVEALRDAAEGHGKQGLRSLAIQLLSAAATMVGGDADEAIRLVQEALASRASQPGKLRATAVLSMLATAYLMRGDLAAAEGAARAALADAGDSPTLRTLALSMLADVRLAQGRPHEALEMAEAGLALMPPLLHETAQSRLYLVRADALYKTGGDGSAALAAARDRVLAGAARIEDPELRRTFLEGVQGHARTIALARERLG